MKNIILVLLIGISMSFCASGGTKSTPSGKSISFEQTNLYPEGLEFDEKSNLFLVTSLKEGMVGKVSMDGKYTPFIKDNDLISAIGIRIDSANNRILVCNSDPGASVKTKKESQRKIAGLGIYDLSTGKKLKYIDLAKLAKDGNHFANDIALDDKGNIYVTNSFSPIIYKIGKGDKPEILINHERFKGQSFNFNGLVFESKTNSLIVAKSNEGILFKFPLSDPTKFTEVKTDKLVGADGLLWGENGKLIVIQNASGKVVELESSDNWTTAKETGSFVTGSVFPTTGIKTKNGIFVLYAMLHRLFDQTTKHTVNKFTIQEVKF